MPSHTYLVFGDLHGRILPAFCLALAWQREHKKKLAGLLQVGDLGYFPDSRRLDRATLHHAKKDPLELGMKLVVNRNDEADAVFTSPDLPQALWFTAGNHEDYAALSTREQATDNIAHDFPVDYYQRVRCVRDGHVVTLLGGFRVGVLWGIADRSPNARFRRPSCGRIQPHSVDRLMKENFDVLLTHDSPQDAVFCSAGSADISAVIHQVRPSFAFFGHYHHKGRLDDCDFTPTRVYHLRGLELRDPGGCAEAGSVGVLRWSEKGGRFEYLDPAWLRSFTRQNWRLQM